MAMISPGITVRIDAAHARKHASNASGASSEKTRPKVSCDGIPLGNSRNCRNQASFARPNCAMATQPSAPASVAAMARITMSSRLCRRRNASRGSSSTLKWPMREESVSGVAIVAAPYRIKICVLWLPYDTMSKSIS